jgi:hypothetical protein
MSQELIELNIQAKPVKKDLDIQRTKMFEYLVNKHVSIDMALLITKRITNPEVLEEISGSPSHILNEGFTWSDSPEGHAFWSSFHSSFP